MPRAPKTPGAKPWSKKQAAVFRSPDEEWADDIVDRLVEACHPKQRDFVLDPGRRVVACLGRGGGKTTGGLARFTKRMVRTVNARCIFVATTKLDAEELIWEKLKQWVERLGIDATFNGTKLRCTFKRNGSTLRLVGADDQEEVDKLRGKPFHEVGIDEASVHKASLLSNLVHRAVGPRLGDYKGALWMIGTPGHILSGLFYEASSPRNVGAVHRPYADRDRDEYEGWTRWSSHSWSLEEAAKHVEAIQSLWEEALVEKEANGWSDNNPIWLREYMGRWAADNTTTVFQYNDAANQWDPAPGLEALAQLRAALKALPDDVGEWHFVVAADMGHADPFALNVYAFAPSDPKRRTFHVMAFERTKMYAKLIAEVLLGPTLDVDAPGGVLGVIGWPDGLVIDADAAIIEELANVYGIRFAKAERKIDYKFGAIELVNGDLVDGRIFVIKNSPLEQQLQQLQWEADDFSGRQREHKAQANHSSDTLIYGRRLIAHMFEVGVAVAPAEPTEKAKKRDPVETGEIPGQVGGEFGALLSDGDYVDPWDEGSDRWGNNE